MPDHLINDLELSELIKTYQVHIHSKTCWKYNKNERRFSHEERQEILTWRNTLLSQVKSYIDNNLYHGKVNVIDPTKDNFIEPLSFKEILDEF